MKFNLIKIFYKIKKKIFFENYLFYDIDTYFDDFFFECTSICKQKNILIKKTFSGLDVFNNIDYITLTDLIFFFS